MSHILPPDLVTSKTSAKLDKHRMCFLLTQENYIERGSFISFRRGVKNNS